MCELSSVDDDRSGQFGAFELVEILALVASRRKDFDVNGVGFGVAS